MSLGGNGETGSREAKLPRAVRALSNSASPPSARNALPQQLPTARPAVVTPGPTCAPLRRALSFAPGSSSSCCCLPVRVSREAGVDSRCPRLA